MSEEPGYLQAVKRAKQEKVESTARPAAQTARPSLSVQEREAVRWAGETAKTEVRSTKDLSGARFCLLLKLAGASGSASFALEGFTSKDLLVGRIKKAGTMQEEVMGAYEVNNGRPLTPTIDGETVTFAAGAPRAGAKPVTPEQMLRKAQAEAAIRAKERPANDDRNRGGRR
jgi:hypothetical protein